MKVFDCINPNYDITAQPKVSCRPGPGVTKKSPLPIFEVSFVYNLKSIQAIILKFGTCFRSKPPEPCAEFHDDRCVIHYVIHDFILTKFR